MIYLDNNGTTPLCKAAQVEYCKWMKCAQNASSTSKVAEASARKLEEFKKYVQTHTGTRHHVIITSGATESNCTILNAVAKSYRRLTRHIPTIVISELEHDSIVECCKALELNQMAYVRYVAPSSTGEITPESLAETLASCKYVALVSIMSANNETGIINPISKLAKVCRRARIPFHSDMVQSFGKFKGPYPDAFSASFHKFQGPLGLGVLCVAPKFLREYEIQAEITGHQQNGLRGGTENIPAIAAGLVALRNCFEERERKNEEIAKLRTHMLVTLNKEFRVRMLGKEVKCNTPYIVLFGRGTIRKPCTLPNTALISIVTPGTKFCNVELKKELDRRGVVVGIGSTCNAKNKNRSHVMSALRVSDEIARGVIRVSLGDNTTKSEISEFVKIFVASVRKQL